MSKTAKPTPKIVSVGQRARRDALAAGKLYQRALTEAQKPGGDLALVARLLTKATSLGGAEAAYALATWYLFGKEPHVHKNMPAAIALLKHSAALGSPSAMFDLAVSYETGKGSKKNGKRAFDLYLRAALRGDADGIFAVGRCFYWGIGVERDERLAEFFYERSKELGSYLRSDED